MTSFTLTKENPTKTFRLNAADSYLLIKCVHIAFNNHVSEHSDTHISNLTLSAEMHYFVYTNDEKGLTDERKHQFPVPILPDLYQHQPVVTLNKLIRNETFTFGQNSDDKFYETLQLELTDIHAFEKIHSLTFDIESHEILE